jgi:hypothetical protein
MRHDAAVTRRLVALVIVALAASVAGCLNVQAPDLFLVTRTGAPSKLKLLVNDGGTIRCNGGPAKPLPDKMLLEARDLTTMLSNDVKHRLRFLPSAHSVAVYKVRVQNGTLTFPDTAARQRSELAQLELFAVQAAHGPCGLRG